MCVCQLGAGEAGELGFGGVVGSIPAFLGTLVNKTKYLIFGTVFFYIEDELVDILFN